MKKTNKKRSLDNKTNTGDLTSMNAKLLRDHVYNTTIKRKNKHLSLYIKWFCLIGLFLILIYLTGCIYIDWSSLGD